jgi:hypothetical protein
MYVKIQPHQHTIIYLDEQLTNQAAAFRRNIHTRCSACGAEVDPSTVEVTLRINHRQSIGVWQALCQSCSLAFEKICERIVGK